MSEETKTIRPRLDSDELKIITIALSVLEKIPRSEWEKLVLEGEYWAHNREVVVGRSVLSVDRIFDMSNVDMEKVTKTAERFRAFGLAWCPEWWSYKGYEEKRQKPYYSRPRRK